MIMKVIASHSSASFVQKITQSSPEDTSELIKKVLEGLPFKAISVLERGYGITRREIAEALLVSPALMGRREKSGRLSPSESDRALRLAATLDKSVVMMNGDRKAAATWMRSPRDALGGESPLMHLQTEIGAREVEDLISRIQHGVFC